MVQLYCTADDTAQDEMTKILTSQVAMLTEQVAKLAELVTALVGQVPLVAQGGPWGDQATHTIKIAEKIDTEQPSEPASVREELYQATTTLERIFTTAPTKGPDDQGQPEDLLKPLEESPVDDCVEPESGGHGQQVAMTAESDSTAGHVGDEDIDLPDINSEYTDSDDGDRRKDFPEWTKGDKLMQALKDQELFNPDALFGPTQRPKVRNLFGHGRTRGRTGSVGSEMDCVTIREEIEHARRMGYTNQ